jgi:predicted GNAT family acetyltransferase
VLSGRFERFRMRCEPGLATPCLGVTHLSANGIRDHLRGVDWVALKTRLAEDQFDSGRSPEQLRRSFENSRHVVIVHDEGQVVGTARALSDGVCNAYIVDVWTHAPHRGRGIASAMIRRLLGKLPGQHVALFTADITAFYTRLGFAEERTGMSQVVGTWLKTDLAINESVG